MSPLVSPQWLAQKLGDPRTVVLDCIIEFQIPSETEKDTLHNIPGARRSALGALIMMVNFVTYNRHYLI